jgi:hypothetical protein
MTAFSYTDAQIWTIKTTDDLRNAAADILIINAVVALERPIK